MAKKPAATISHQHVCPKVTGKVPHVGGPVVSGSANVFIGGKPAARVGDTLTCVGPPDTITQGSSGVFINGKPAARLGDGTAHGGKIVMGEGSVMIGESSATAGVMTVVPSPNLESITPAPKTWQALIERIEQATLKLQECRYNHLPLPQPEYSVADQLAMVEHAKGEQGLEETFIARIVETQYAQDDNTIGRPLTNSDGQVLGQATYWTTTYSQIEHADSNAAMICAAVGKPYNPAADYTLLLIDQQKANEVGDMVSFVPTYDNIKAFAKRELANEIDAQITDIVMDSSYSETYEMYMQAVKANNIDLDDPVDYEEFIQSMGLNEQLTQWFEERRKLDHRLGATEEFLGSGLSKNTRANNPETPFGEVYEGFAYGVLETFTYDKNPQTLGILAAQGIVKRLELH